MRIHDVMKNIFLGVVLLLIFVAPTMSDAAYDYGKTHADKLKKAGWTDAQIKKLDENVNNLSSGSTYKNVIKDPETGAVIVDDSVNLYNSNPKKDNLSPTELLGLKSKLTEGGSNVKQSDLSVNNVYQLNDGNTTNYIYDPTPNNLTNNDAVVLGTATKERQFLSYKNPIAKETPGSTIDQNINSRDTNSLDGILNANDIAQGRTSGATVSAKNRIQNLENDQAGLMQEKNDAEDEVNALQEQLNQTTDPAQRASIQKALADATTRMNNASSSLANTNSALSGAYASQAAASLAANTKSGTPEECKSSLSNPAGPVSSFYCILTFVSMGTNIIFKLTSFVAYIAGTLFDYSLELSINSAEFFKRLGVIEVTWSFIRDILNMTFIFILLWTAVQILIGNEGKYNAKKMLLNVILVAILINFSLFAAKLMVDGSNIVSLKIYEAMKVNTESQSATISERVMNTVGLSTLYNIGEIFKTDSIQAVGQCASNPGALITISVMGSIFLIILILALGLAAILFLVRLVNIIFLFIRSPLWVWAHVIPGNSTMEKIKNEWWSEMRHVLVFPIMYLFWMLVAVIIFEKLGRVKEVAADGSVTNGVSLLDLICNAPGTGGVGQSISLVAIFCIVIIFMMKAIEYGVRHAGDGGSGAIGNKFASNWANKFAGYQTAMTKGLAKKAGTATLATGAFAGQASIGATKVPLRAVTGGIGALKNKENRWEGFKDGYINPSVNTKESLRNVARAITAKTANNGLANFVGLTGAAAKLAAKYDDPKNSRGETRKEADKRRSDKAVKDEEMKYDAIDKQYKVITQKEWMKKNPRGTVDEYEQYIVDSIEKRTNALLGAGITGMVGKGGNTHLENLKKAAITRYEEDDKDENGVVRRDAAGNAIRVEKIRFNESAMHDTVTQIIGHEPTAEVLKDKKTKFTTLRNVKAKARIKAVSEKVKSNRSNASNKKTGEDRTKKYEEEIKDLRKEIGSIPDDSEIINAVNTTTVYVPPTPAGGGTPYDGKTLRAVNSAIVKYNMELGRVGGPRANKLLELENKMKDARQAFIDHAKKINTDVIKKEADYNSHLAKLAEEKNK